MFVVTLASILKNLSQYFYTIFELSIVEHCVPPASMQSSNVCHFILHFYRIFVYAMLIIGLVEELLKLKKTHEKTCFWRLHYEIKDTMAHIFSLKDVAMVVLIYLRTLQSVEMKSVKFRSSWKLILGLL